VRTVLGMVVPGAATLEATAGTLNACLPHTGPGGGRVRGNSGHTCWPPSDGDCQPGECLGPDAIWVSRVGRKGLKQVAVAPGLGPRDPDLLHGHRLCAGAAVTGGWALARSARRTRIAAVLMARVSSAMAAATRNARATPVARAWW